MIYSSVVLQSKYTFARNVDYLPLNMDLLHHAMQGVSSV